MTIDPMVAGFLGAALGGFIGAVLGSFLGRRGTRPAQTPHVTAAINPLAINFLPEIPLTIGTTTVPDRSVKG